MAGPVLGALLKLDTKQFDDPLKKATSNVREFQKSMKAAQAVIAQTATAEEKFAAGQKRLIGLHQQGLLSTRQYTAAVAQLRNELGVLSVTQQASARAAITQEAAMRRAAIATREANAVAKIRNNAAIAGRTAAAARRSNFLFGAGNVGTLAAGLGVSPLMLGTAGLGIGAGVGIGKSIGAAARFEQTQTSFRALLGNRNTADNLLGSITREARTTPFDRTELEQGSKALLAYGFSAQEVIPILRRLGDISAGLGLSIEDLTRLYGESAVQGRAYAKDLRQFTTRGIDILTPLAKQFGVTKDEIFDLAAEGKIGFAELDKAIKSLTDPGGRFFGQMVEQSKTLLGQWSNLKDAAEEFGRNVGNVAVPAVKQLIDFGNNLANISNIQEVERAGGGASAAVSRGGNASEINQRLADRRKEVADLRRQLAIGAGQERVAAAWGANPSEERLALKNALATAEAALRREEVNLSNFNRASQAFSGRQSLGAFLRSQADATERARVSAALRGALSTPDSISFDGLSAGWSTRGRRQRGRFTFGGELEEAQTPPAITRGSGAAASAIVAANTAQSRVAEVSQQQLAVQKAMEQHLANIAAAAFQGNVFGAGVPTVEFR